MGNWRPSTKPLDAAIFQEVTTAHQCVVIHFWADWNLIDKDMDLILTNLRLKFSEQVAFYSLDTMPKESLEICRHCNILNLPALVCFINGQLHEKIIGLLPEKELEAKLITWANSAEHE